MDSNSKQNILAGLVCASPIGSRLEPNGGANSALSSASLGAGSATPGTAGRQHKLKQRFTVIRKLGKGTYGKVQLAINKSTGQEVAIKTIKKSKIESPQDLERVRREIQIMSSIEHPHIIHIYEVFENKDKIVLVMQYAPGGELYEYVSEQKVLEESEARRLFRQIATAIYYCHKNKICHRDLKLENILLDEKNNAKIADFGLSNVFDKRRQLRTFCGSPLYASPEIVQGSPYEGPEVDCWSLGVLLYTLVYGAMPFDGSNLKRLVKQISESAYLEPKQKSQASPLIGKLLCADPNKRATIVDVCSDAWVNGLSHPASPSSPSSPQSSSLPATSLLQVAQDMANLTPVRFDILLALAPPSSPPPPPSVVAVERPPLARPLASQSNVLNVAQKKPAIMEMDESSDAAADGHSPVASYIVRDLTQEMEENKENVEVAPNEAQPEAQLDEPKTQNEDLKLPEERDEPMEVEQPKAIEMNPILPKEEEKTEVKAGQEEEAVARMEVELAQSPQSPPEEPSVQPEVEQPGEDTENKGPLSEVEQQKDEEKQEGDMKPAKKVKKKIVVVKKKKKVSTKRDGVEGEVAGASDGSKGDKSKSDKSADERTSIGTSINTSTGTGTGNGAKKTQQQVGAEKVGKVKIPDSFSGQPAGGESPPAKGSLETRRQSALVADVAQKLLLASQQTLPGSNSELKDDLASLASVRVSETKDEFERRASLATAAATAAAVALQAREGVQGEDGLQEPGKLEDARTLRELLDILDQSAVLEPVRAASPKEAEMLVAREKILTEKSAGDERSDSVETIKAQEEVAQPLKMAPITRSYKKVTFTRDGACVTETGRIYSTRGEDGTLRRVERKSKVTHYPSHSPDGRREEMSQQEEEEVTSYGDEADLNQWPPSGKPSTSRAFEKLIMPSSSLFDDNDNNDDDDDTFTLGHRTASAIGHRRPSSQRGQFKRADSRSSCSSGSTDAFDDIFDTWTGAISMFSSSNNNNWPGSSKFGGHNNFRPLSSLFGTTGRRRQHQSASNSPRCASADVGAGPSWPQQQQQRPQPPHRPRSGWSPHSSGYDSDAPPDRPASSTGGAGPSGRRPRSSLFGSSQQLASLFQQPSCSSLGGELARSLAAEHEQLKRRLDRQHRQLWKGSTPSLFDEQFNADANEDLFSPNLFRSSSKKERERSPNLAGRPPRPGPSTVKQQQQVVEQSQSSSSAMRQSLAMSPAPCRVNQQTQVERSSSMVRSQLANLRLSSSATGDSLAHCGSSTKPATFIELKRTSSIKRMETHQLKQELSKSNTASVRSTAFFELAPSAQEVVGAHQRGAGAEAEVEKRAAEERVQHWLRDNTGASSAGSQSSASKTASSASLQSAAASSANAASQLSKHSVTSFATSSASRRRLDDLQQHQFAKTTSKQEVFSLREEFEALQDDGATSSLAKRTNDRLEWVSQSQNDLLNSPTKETQQQEEEEEEEESGFSLLEQLRSRGYRSLISRRMVVDNDEQQQVGSTNNEMMIAQNLSQQVQAQVSSESGLRRHLVERRQHHFTSSLATRLALNEDQLADSQELQEEGRPEAPLEGSEVKPEEDEDVREAKENIKAYVERMRETELFLKSLEQLEEEQARRQREQSFLFDNLMLSASRFVGPKQQQQQPLSYINLATDIEWMPSPMVAGGSCSAPIKPATSGGPLTNGYIVPLSQAYPLPSSDCTSGAFIRAFAAPKAVDPLEPVQPVQQVLLSTRHFDTSAPMMQRQNFRRSKSQLSDQFQSHRPLLVRSPADVSSQNLDPLTPRRPISMRLTRGEPAVAGLRSRRSLSQVRWPSGAWSGASATASTSEHHRWGAYCDHLKAPQTPRTNAEEEEEEEDGMSEYRAASYVPKVVPQGPPPPLRQARAERLGRSQQRASSVYLERAGELQVTRRRNSMQQPIAASGDASRRPSATQESPSSSSRLTELEQRIQENKRRRQQLLSGEDSSLADRKDNEENHETCSSNSSRQTIRLASRPSRLESMEARIKRRSYCVQVAGGECSPERRSSTGRRGSFLM